MASEENSETVTNLVENDQSEHKKRISEILDDREARDSLIQKLRKGGHVARYPPSSGAEAFMFPSTSNMFSQMSSSPWLMFPSPHYFGNQQLSCPQVWVSPSLVYYTRARKDIVSLLDAKEVMEFATFNPTVTDDSRMGGGRHH